MTDVLEDQLLALSDADRAFLAWQAAWCATARPEQLPPDTGWTEFGALAGRGFGKTRVGAEWLGRVAYEDAQAMPRAVIAPTQADVRFTCFEGESGLCSVIPPECIASYNRTDLLMTLTNGATIRGFSAEKADRLRGPQHADVWCVHPSTVITMGDMSLKTVVDVAAGDSVMTRSGPRRVLAAGPSGNPNPYVQVQALADNGDEITLHCTTDHPIRANGDWVAAGTLKAGARLLAYETTVGCVARDIFLPAFIGATVTGVYSRAHAAERPDPWCLKVEGEPEYFANGILVHNCDELAAWGKDAGDTWDMMQFGLRLGPLPRALWTTTPKPVEIVRRLTAPQPGRIIVRGSTYDNKANLPASFFKALEQYEGTRIGRQELHGEMIDPEESGVIKRSWLNLWPAKNPLPRFDWIIMSLDTAYTEKSVDKKGDPDPTACGVWGVFNYKGMTHAMLLDCWEDHLGLPELMRRVKREMNTAYGDDEDQALIRPLFGSGKPMTSGRKPDILLIEDKGSGISLRQMLAESRIEAYAYNPGRADKLTRLHIVSPIFAQRRVWVPESDKHPGRPRTWCEPLIAQLCAFTGEGSIRHDDHVDACTQALRLMMDKKMLKLVKDPPKTGGDRPPPKVIRNPYAQ